MELAALVQELVTQREPESSTLDFKRDLPGSSDGDRRDFSHDVTAMANTRGGKIIYGVDEDTDSRAARIAPLQGEPGKAVERLTNMIASSVEPRLSGVSIHADPVEGGFVLVVDIPQQFDGPFQAQHQNRIAFKCRVGASNRDMTYGQLRGAFGERSRFLGELRQWRDDRLDRHQRQILMHQLAGGPWAILHAMPLSAFGEHLVPLDPRRLASAGYGVQTNKRYNSFGIQFLRPTGGKVCDYIQFFRQGMVEAGWTCAYTSNSDLDGPPPGGYQSINSVVNALNVRKHLRGIGEALDREGIASSVYVGLALLGVGNMNMYCSTRDGFGDVTAQQYEPNIVFPEQLIERTDELIESPGVVAKRLLDEMWQAFGHEQCEDFDDAGTWRDPRMALYA